MSETVQVLPMPKVHPIWEHPGISRYPETIRVSFTDGKVVTYHIDANLPHPCFEAAMKNLSNMNGGGILPGQMSIDDFIGDKNDESTV